MELDRHVRGELHVGLVPALRKRLLRRIWFPIPPGFGWRGSCHTGRIIPGRRKWLDCQTAEQLTHLKKKERIPTSGGDYWMVTIRTERKSSNSIRRISKLTSNETSMLRTLRRRHDSALKLLEKLYVFEREIEKACGHHWAAASIRRVLVAGGRMRPGAGPRNAGPMKASLRCMRKSPAR